MTKEEVKKIVADMYPQIKETNPISLEALLQIKVLVEVTNTQHPGLLNRYEEIMRFLQNLIDERVGE